MPIWRNRRRNLAMPTMAAPRSPACAADRGRDRCRHASAAAAPAACPWRARPRHCATPSRRAAGRHPALVGRAERRPHDDLAAQREREQEHGAEERQHSEPWQQPDDDDEHQRPGRIEDREDAFAADERAQAGRDRATARRRSRARSALRRGSPRARARTAVDRARRRSGPAPGAGSSRAAEHQQGKPASTVSATRVSTWPLGSTRSNTWNM